MHPPSARTQLEQRVASGAPGARRGPPPPRSRAGTWPRFPHRAACDAPTRPLGAPCSADQTEVGFVGRPVRAGRAGLGDTPPPRPDPLATTAPGARAEARGVGGNSAGPGSRQNPRTPGKQGAARARRRATASAPRTEPEPSTLPLIFAPGILSAAHRSPAHHAPAVESLRSSGAALLPLCSLHSPAADHAEPLRGRPAVAVAFPRTRHLRPVPLARSRDASAARHAEKRKNRLRALPHRCGWPPLSATRPEQRPALPTLLTRAARPSLRSPPTPQPLAGHRSRAHPIHASPQVVAGAVEVHWCPRARLGPPAVDHVERLLMRVAVVHARAPRTPPRRFLTPIPRLVSSLHRRGGLLATPWSFRFISRSPVRRPARATRSCAASFASPPHASLTTSFLSLSFFLSPLPLTAAGRRLDECREASYARSVK